MLELTHVDTACALLSFGGWRFLTDPVFDAPGGHYHFGFGALSRKHSTPALTADQVGAVDAVLLSHHQHGDNLDRAGTAFTAQAAHVLTTRAAARRFGGGHGLAPFETHVMSAPGRDDVRITATPAQHRPGYMPEFLSGPVIGFILESAALPHGALYITGDTVLCDGVRDAATRFKVHTLVVHVGAVRFPWLTLGARYTFDAREALALAQLTNALQVVPIHTSGWSHFREGPSEVVRAFDAAGERGRLHVPVPGTPLTLDV